LQEFSWCGSMTISASSCPRVLNVQDVNKKLQEIDHRRSAKLIPVLRPVRMKYSVWTIVGALVALIVVIVLGSLVGSF
jgi:hypothetical protein